MYANVYAIMNPRDTSNPLAITPDHAERTAPRDGK